VVPRYSTVAAALAGGTFMPQMGSVCTV
jgi:hypothetical protein